MNIIKRWICLILIFIYSCNKYPNTQHGYDILIQKSINKTIDQLINDGYIK